MSHPAKAAAFLENTDRVRRHDEAVWVVRSKRDVAVHGVPDWEQLRQTASDIKAHTMSRLDDYLEMFEQSATSKGATVHWARTPEEHNEIVRGILSDHGATHVVKSKSMLTEECHLNPYLERHGIHVVDTDLGERIVQLREEPPSHVVAPAVHLSKEDISDVFHEHLGTEKGESDPEYLVEAARHSLRSHFLKAQAGITGVNFALAETGGIVVVTNEGNADMGTSLPDLHIACMGIEKLIPRAIDLGVFVRLLARASTGQPISVYTSHFHGPRPGGQLHIVMLDNGRSELLRQNDFRRSLHCIRCGACLNTCPVYRRSGGYSYGYTIPGPIGAVQAPSRDIHKHASLPYASSLCGSCTDVCPVKIDLHQQLLTWRRHIVERKALSWSKRMTMKWAAMVMRRTWLYQLVGKLARWTLPKLPRWIVYNRFNAWGRQRELPPMPKESFRDLYRKRKRSQK